MNKRILISLGALLSIILLTMVSLSTSCEKTKGQILNHPGATKSFSGTGSYTSESFVISGPDWTISWDFDTDPSENGTYVNYFGIDLQRLGDGFTLHIVPRIDNISSKHNQRVYMDKSGTFQLKIDSAGGSWEIRVYDFGRQ